MAADPSGTSPDSPDSPDSTADTTTDPTADTAAVTTADPTGGLGDRPDGFRSGFVSFVGRPNTGKSTLTNALVGEKIAITADQPETTRHPVRGIVHRPDAQVVVVDTPGLHRPRTLLGERLNDMVKETYSDVDVIGVCVPANEKISPGDRWIVDAVRTVAPRTPLVGIVTKVDTVSKDRVGEQLLALHDLLGVDVVPVSAVDGIQTDVLLDVIVGLLPEGPKYYPDDHVTDDDTETRMAELIREAALGGLHDELPHSVAVQIDEMFDSPTRPGVLQVHAVIFVERDGQKAIIRGKGGRRLTRIVHDARREIIDLLDRNVYLDLRIKVAKNWQTDPKQLGRMGF
ncbi:GTPase Era [Corynebacterium bovis]|uniref:GTPase Era n=1 Tax=Corynebacterium bovis TaxID=36808 RepID=A0A3R8PDR7_9CORY|nr:GTPase Era [Corynebacterium bovis]MDN8579120.1 GTPase Era [Corynebacterium bovis]RRO87662.1 GTPase Era [Corynebacterium bovis]RRO89022.1 GTPase Era [Corynebacterium bovis]